MPKCTIDGREIEVPAGTTLIQAAAQLGYTQVYYDELPIQVNNWRPYAQAIQAKGVRLLL